MILAKNNLATAARSLVPLSVVALIVVALVGDSGQMMGSYDRARFFLMIVCSVVLISCFWVVYRPPLVVLMGFSIFIGAGLASLLSSDVSSATLAEVLQYLVYFTAAWLLASMFFAHPEDEWIRYSNFLVVAIGIGVSVYALLTLLTYGWFLADGGGALHIHLPIGFPHRRFWSHLATWSLPLFPVLLLWLSDKGASPATLWALRAAAGVWIWVLMLSMGRGSLVSLSTAMIFVAIVLGASGRVLFREMLRIVAVGVLLWLLLSYAVPDWLFDAAAKGRDFHTTSSGRLGLWARAWELSLQNFPLGVGPLGWPTEDSTVAAPHSMLWVWASEWGWLSILGLLLIVGATVRQWLKLRRSVVDEGPTERGLRITGLTASVVAALIHSQVSGIFILPWSMFLGLWILALFLAVVWRPALVNNTSCLGNASFWKKGMAGVVVAALLTGTWYAVLEYHSQMVEYNLVDWERKKPRFWIDGRVPFRGAEPQSADGS
ncbi:O-antigen ligase family protein [Gilvimarinus sp. F26214L]|uniref:O-antigen ligase family protein n=1 Tax=Gilvimarinus sp. DZF01 TaxID=3461371 RepID=UPI00404597A4